MTGAFILILTRKRLLLSTGKPPCQIAGASRAHARAALGAVARLHATYWDRVRTSGADAHVPLRSDAQARSGRVGIRHHRKRERGDAEREDHRSISKYSSTQSKDHDLSLYIQFDAESKGHRSIS